MLHRFYKHLYVKPYSIELFRYKYYAISMFVLVADDDNVVRRLLEKICQHLGWRVLAFARGDELAEAALRHRPGLIVSDLHMAGMDGLQACTKIRRALPATAIVFVTGDRLGAATLRAAGFTAVLEKPFTVHEAIRLLTGSVKA